jgi:mRNA-degrading endonuclease RelE of RelBE toxin-antitoxin system
MEFSYTAKFKKQYKKLPQPIKKSVKKQLGLLFSNPDPLSLKIKKMQDPREIWEGRISHSYRFTFQKTEDGYVLRAIGTHDILNNP